MKSPPPVFGCEPQRKFNFSLNCKRSLQPVLTHQFEVNWPWPVLQRDERSRSDNTPDTPQDVLDSLGNTGDIFIDGRDGNGVNKENLLDSSAPGDEDTTPAYNSAPPLWCERRRYGRPTFILDLSGDPFLGRHETRRVSLLLSPGYRNLLPLVELGAPEKLPDNAGVAFWRTAFKPFTRGAQELSPSSSPRTAHPPPYCAELVIGEVSNIEEAVRQRREMARGSSRRSTQMYRKPSFLSRISLGPCVPPVAGEAAGCGEGTHLATHSDPSAPQSATPKDVAYAATMGSAMGCGDGEEAKMSTSPAPSSRSLGGSSLAPKRVFTYFFYTVPFRVRWLSQISGCIVVSLPCEERLLTLYASHVKDQHRNASQLSTLSASARDSTTSTAIIPITCVHSFSLPRGVVPLDIAEVFDRPFLAVGTAEHGVLLCQIDKSTGAVEGIVRWISLRGYGSAFFPVTRLAAVFPELGSENAPNHVTVSSSSPPWAERTAALERLRDGVLLCSSLYDPTVAVIKLGVAAEGVLEEFSALRGVDTILDVSASVHPDVGPLVCTVSRKLLRMRVVDTSEEESTWRISIFKNKTYAGLADRVHPCLAHHRLARLEAPILHVASSPAVLQCFTENYVSRHSYTKHWQVVVDSFNQVVLLDRKISQYVAHSTFHLCRRDMAVAKGESGVSTRQHLPNPPTANSPETSPARNSCANTREDGTNPSHMVSADVSCDTGGLQPQPTAGAAGGHKRPRSSTQTAKKSTSTTTVKGRRSKAALPAAAAKKAEGPGDEAVDASDDGENTPLGKTNSCYSLISTIPIEEICSGLVVISAGNEMIQVAAAHDRECISIVTWSIGGASPPTPSPPTTAITTTITAACADASKDRRVSIETG